PCSISRRAKGHTEIGRLARPGYGTASAPWPLPLVSPARPRSTGQMDSSSGGDPYRSHLAGEGEKNTVWRHGAPPTYDAVNALFEAERTQEWPAGSLEEVVQNAIKTWEMELSHK
ncbi:unnamed protein product, partial [Urochloa humidicola]